MNISFWLNGVYRQEEIEPGMLLIDFLREKGCYSVKRGCETANCGLCTVLVEDRPILSCSTLAARIDGKKVVTMWNMKESVCLQPALYKVDVYKRQEAERSTGIRELSCK